MPIVPASLVQWNGTDTWLSEIDNPGLNVYCFIVFNNHLYSGTGGYGQLYRWDDINSWILAADQWLPNPLPPHDDDEYIIDSLVVLNGSIYGHGNVTGRLFVWDEVDGDVWTPVTPNNPALTGSTNIIVFNGNIYCSGYFDGKLRQWNGTDDWIILNPVATTGISPIIAFNNKIYGVSNNNLYHWDGINSWVQDTTVDVGIQVMTVLNDTLYGVDSNGALYVFKVGGININPSGNIQNKLMSSGLI